MDELIARLGIPLAVGYDISAGQGDPVLTDLACIVGVDDPVEVRTRGEHRENFADHGRSRAALVSDVGHVEALRLPREVAARLPARHEVGIDEAAQLPHEVTSPTIPVVTEVSASPDQ